MWGDARGSQDGRFHCTEIRAWARREGWRVTRRGCSECEIMLSIDSRLIGGGYSKEG